MMPREAFQILRYACDIYYQWAQGRRAFISKEEWVSPEQLKEAVDFLGKQPAWIDSRDLDKARARIQDRLELPEEPDRLVEYSRRGRVAQAMEQLTEACADATDEARDERADLITHLRKTLLGAETG